MTASSPSPRPDPPNRWIGPTILLALMATVVVLFIASNTVRTTVSFAGFDWANAPLWFVIVIALVVGAVGSRLLGWVWRSWRRRRRRLAEEANTLRHRAPDPNG